MITYNDVKEIVTNKLVTKTEERSYEDLSELIFGEGNCFNESEVRKRMYGMKRLIDIIESTEYTYATSILSLSDIHVPFQKDFHVLSKYVGKIDVLQLNGDILDCKDLSKFPKMYRTNPVEEMIECRQYLIDLINYIKPKRIVANYGNHCLRLGSYLAKHLDSELQELMPLTGLDYIFTDGFTHYDRRLGTKTKYSPLVDVFPNIKFEYTGKWFSIIGDCIFAHPKTFSSSPLKTAEKAMYWFRNEGYNFSTLVMAHTHRVGQYKIGNSNIFEQGAFCETGKMVYGDGMLVNSQKQGFVVLYQDENGKTIESMTRLVSLN